MDGWRLRALACLKIRILTASVQQNGATRIQQRMNLVEQFVIAAAAVGQESIALAGGQFRCRVEEFLELNPAFAVHEVKPVCPPRCIRVSFISIQYSASPYAPAIAVHRQATAFLFRSSKIAFHFGRFTGFPSPSSPLFCYRSPFPLASSPPYPAYSDPEGSGFDFTNCRWSK